MSLHKLLKATLNQQLLVSPLLEKYLMSSKGELRLSTETIEWMAQELAKPPRYRGLTFSASSAGSCTRMQVFRFIGAPSKQRHSSETNALFIAGHFAHLKWQALLRDAGILAEAEVSVELPEYRLTGTIDGLLSSGKGWELKSANQRVYSFVMQQAKPKIDHVLQVHCYMKMTGIDKWSLVYENRGTAEWKEFVVNFDDSIWDSIEKDLKIMNEAEAAKTLPPMLPDCEDQTGRIFKACPFNAVCPAGEYSRGVLLMNVNTK